MFIARLEGQNERIRFSGPCSCGDKAVDSVSIEIDWKDNGSFCGGVLKNRDAQKLLKLLQTCLQQTNGGAKPKLPKR